MNRESPHVVLVTELTSLPLISTTPGLFRALSSTKANGLSVGVMVGVNREESFKSM